MCQICAEAEASPRITTTPDFWDCDCKKNYIKPVHIEHCWACGYDSDNCPDSRILEVHDLYGHQITKTPEAE